MMAASKDANVKYTSTWPVPDLYNNRLWYRPPPNLACTITGYGTGLGKTAARLSLYPTATIPDL